MNIALKKTLALFAPAIALLSASALRADLLTFNVDIFTAGLNANSANAPFDLDFQLLYGNSALTSNTVALSNFSFAGGTALGSPVLSGSATGSLDSLVSLTASSAQPFSELYQQFSSGTTEIRFTATINEPGPDVGIPSQFSVGILDQSLGFPAQLFTTAPDTASLLTLDLSSSNTADNAKTYAAVSSADGNTKLSGVYATVPESSGGVAILGEIVVMFAYCARCFRKWQTA